MAGKQGERNLKQQEKRKQTAPHTGAVLHEPAQAQPENILLEQAAERPDQASPESVLHLQRQFGNTQVQRALEDGADEKLPVNRQGELSQHVTREIQRARSGGSPMPGPLNQQVSQQLHGDFSQVRLHTDRQADRLSGQLQARAFTLGNNIFFRQGAYAPHSARGQHTLLHELTHVMQQSGSPDSAGPLKLGPTGDRFEQDANRAAHQAADHSAARQSGVSTAQAVQRAVVQREGGNTAPATTSQPPRRLPPLPPQQAPVVSNTGTQNATVNPTAHQAPTNPLPPVPVRQPAVTVPQTATQTAQQTGPKTGVKPPVPQNKALPPLPAPKTAPKTPPPVTNPVPEELHALGVTQAKWNALSDQKRTIARGLIATPAMLTGLVDLIFYDRWIKDGADNDLLDSAKIHAIYESFKMDFRQWNSQPKERRTVLLDLRAKPYIKQLSKAARENSWPRNSDNQEIYPTTDLEKINTFFQIPFAKWNGIYNEQRKVLESLPTTATQHAQELGQAALAGNFPRDDSFKALAYDKWVQIKTADASITPETWNQYEVTTRRDILGAATDPERKKIISKANYKQDKTSSLAEKAQKVFDNPIVDALSGGAGTSSSIASATEKEGQSNAVSSGIGLGAASLDTVVQSMTLIGSLAHLTRGQRMASRKNASAASKTLGAKYRREGIWGTASSALGLGGSISSMVSNSSKLHDQKKDEESGLSSRADYASASFATATGSLGMVRGGIGMFKSFGRSSGANKFVKAQPANANETSMNKIAQFTSKNQNRTGKTLETLKSAFTTASGISSFFGNSSAGKISAAVFGGLGLLTGVTNAIVGKVREPDEADLNSTADELIRLWSIPHPDAVRFAREVLKISDTDAPDLKAWAEEDPEAAKDLIKSKLSKY